jgi:hypothetical protein
MISVFFSQINETKIESGHLILFGLYVCSIDVLGDAFIYKGIWEFCSSLRRGQCAYYLTHPSMPWLSVVALRFDIPMVMLGILFATATLTWAGFTVGVGALAIIPFLLVGTLSHAVLTSSYLLIQAYFDPQMPIPLGSPATRLYTKPLHLLLHMGWVKILLSTLYPAYLITGIGGEWLYVQKVSWILLAGGLLGLMLWIRLLNFVIIRTIQMRQG